jgi:hypothetical protein
MCWLLAQLIIGFFSSFFLLRLFTVPMKKTRAIKQSIFLDVYGSNTHTIIVLGKNGKKDIIVVLNVFLPSFFLL